MGPSDMDTSEGSGPTTSKSRRSHSIVEGYPRHLCNIQRCLLYSEACTADAQIYMCGPTHQLDGFVIVARRVAQHFWRMIPARWSVRSIRGAVFGSAFSS